MLNNRIIELTQQEFKILMVLFNSKGKVFSREEILDKTYSFENMSNTRAIDSHIKYMRRKIRMADPQADIVKSIYGVGYKLDLM